MDSWGTQTKGAVIRASKLPFLLKPVLIEIVEFQKSSDEYASLVGTLT
jgi:hypothetical protein